MSGIEANQRQEFQENSPEQLYSYHDTSTSIYKVNLDKIKDIKLTAKNKKEPLMDKILKLNKTIEHD